MAEIHIWQPASGGDLLADASWDTLAPAKQATGQGTFTGVPSNLETVTIGTQVYRWVTSLGGCAANDVLIGGDAEECRDNFLSAILATATDSGVKWCAGTAKNTDVTALANGTDKIDLTSIKYGVGPNGIATTDTSANFSWGGNVQLTGGLTTWTTTTAEIVFNSANHSAMTANLDWDALLDPVIQIAKITKQPDNFSLIGLSGTPWVVTPKANALFNFLGIGAIYFEAKHASNVPDVIHDGPELLVLTGKVKSIHVKGGRCECSADFSGVVAVGGTIATTTGANAILLILDSTKNGAGQVIASAGFIENSRDIRADDTLTVGNGHLLHKGKAASGALFQVLGSGSLDLQPREFAAGSSVFLLMSGRTTFANSLVAIGAGAMVIGPSASVEFGPILLLPTANLIDLRKSHP